MSSELNLEVNDGSGIAVSVDMVVKGRKPDSGDSELNKDWVSKESLLKYLESLRDETGIKYSHTNSMINRFKIKLEGKE